MITICFNPLYLFSKDTNLIPGVPTGNPTADILLQATDYGFTTNTYISDKETTTNEIVTEAPTELIRSTYMTVSYLGEYETSPTSFQHGADEDVQTQSLEEFNKDITNKVNEGFTVPFDTLHANSKESEDKLENNAIDISSETTSDIWVGFLPTSVETNNVVIPFSTIIPETEVPLMEESEGNLATTNAFVYNTTTINIFKTENVTEMSGDEQDQFSAEKVDLTVEPPIEHTSEKTEDSRISTVPYFTEGLLETGM